MQSKKFQLIINNVKRKKYIIPCFYKNFYFKGLETKLFFYKFLTAGDTLLNGMALLSIIYFKVLETK